MKIVNCSGNEKYLRIGIFFIRFIKNGEMRYNFYWESISYNSNEKNKKYHWFVFFNIFGIMWHKNS